MKVEDWLRKSSKILIQNKILTARLDCLVLLEDITGKDRSWLLAHPEFELTADSQVQILDQQILRRCVHEPISYIREKSEFYGRDFVITNSTMQPRPESETFIEILKSLLKPMEKLTLIDVGTGSGALAITIKLEFPSVIVAATDVSKAALTVAKINVRKYEANVNFYEGNLIEPIIKTSPDVIVANLPYVPDAHAINESAKWEPRVAIFGGTDGLDFYRDLFKQISGLPKLPLFVLAESLPKQHIELASVAKKFGYSLTGTDGFIQVFSPTV